MIQFWLLLIVGVVVVVFLGAILQRTGRMIGGCLRTAIVIVSVIVGGYMVFTGTAFCNVLVIGPFVCQLVEGCCENTF